MFLALNDPANAEFVFIAILTQRTEALLKQFSWMTWFCLVEMIKVPAKNSKKLNSTGVYASLSIRF